MAAPATRPMENSDTESMFWKIHRLGERVVLPEWLEDRREEIEAERPDLSISLVSHQLIDTSTLRLTHGSGSIGFEDAQQSAESGLAGFLTMEKTSLRL